MLASIEQRLADEIGVRVQQVQATVALIDDGATVPFIARYRKEATGGLDDVQLRTLDERLQYLRELEQRRTAIIDSIVEQGKMTDALRQQVLAATNKQALEDLYLPYRPKRRTKAQIAREAGLEPLALALLADPNLDPATEATAYVRPDAENPELRIADVKAALDGARQILMERFSEDAAVLAALREHLRANALLTCKVVEGREGDAAKYRDWFDYAESLKDIPSHRALAMMRGRNEEVLRLSVKLPPELLDPPQPSPCIGLVCSHLGLVDLGRPADAWLLEAGRWTWMVKLSLQLELEVMTEVRERSEAEAIRVFAQNLRDLLLAAPAGPRVTMGLDPGVRTGVKVAVVDGTGKLLDTATVYPHEPRRDWEGSLDTLRRLVERHGVSLIAIGNGTASRETDRLAADLMKRLAQATLMRIVVSEAGASVYSASELASREFPDLDVSLRGAVSIARRLQDPLAELVKIDPKSIGVGQYQHDVNQIRLARSLDAVVEDCVNAVGVDLNTASAPLLTRISGLNTSLANNIVAHRNQHGAFRSRRQLLDVPRLGEKTFEQSAGFLRIPGVLAAADGEGAVSVNPLDATAVHPESYALVERVAAGLNLPVTKLIGNGSMLRSVDPQRFVDERFGLPTVRDILVELEKPGRDPRPEFRAASFRDGVEDLKDLSGGMILEGVVTNVTAFGAFVDIGVHQDGLVHISALSEKFVKDPRSVVKAGDVVKVKVLEVDLERKRVALTMRMSDSVPEAGTKAGSAAPRSRPAGPNRAPGERDRAARAPAALGAMAQAFARTRQSPERS